MNEKIYAHTKSDENGKPLSEEQWQPLEEHLNAVAQFAAREAVVFGAEAFAKTTGLLHDIGKDSPEFQAYIRNKRPSVDHKRAGAQAAVDIYGRAFGKLLAYCILGHHGGLPNAAEESIIYDPKPAPSGLHLSSPYLKERPDKPVFHKPFLQTGEGQVAYMQLLIRMAFSCLVDGDYLDTEKFMSPETAALRGEPVPIQTLYELFQPALAKLQNYDIAFPVNRARRDVLNACLENGNKGPGFYTLTVPTGGGKTLSSMAFALEQVKRCGMRRIVYAVPFTTVTEQIAGVFREIFDKNTVGRSLVLEHHSNLDLAGKTEDEKDAVRLLSENWDTPLIVTTTVQLLESLFPTCRRASAKFIILRKALLYLTRRKRCPIRCFGLF
ncbi:hypothetical protein FACS1894211_04900 [Clostridia bacterium]|nr:hypothetical protein FACS1894211_04900 [Clostridia bacterium]